MLSIDVRTCGAEILGLGGGEEDGSGRRRGAVGLSAMEWLMRGLCLWCEDGSGFLGDGG